MSRDKSNPYRPPQNEESDSGAPERKPKRFGILTVLTLIGGIGGLLLLAGILRHPGDPSGNFTGLVIGTLLGAGLGIGLGLLDRLRRP